MFLFIVKVNSEFCVTQTTMFRSHFGQYWNNRSIFVYICSHAASADVCCVCIFYFFLFFLPASFALPEVTPVDRANGPHPCAVGRVEGIGISSSHKGGMVQRL